MLLAISLIVTAILLAKEGTYGLLIGLIILAFIGFFPTSLYLVIVVIIFAGILYASSKCFFDSPEQSKKENNNVQSNKPVPVKQLSHKEEPKIEEVPPPKEIDLMDVDLICNIMTDFHKRRFECLESIKDDLQFILGDNYQEMFDNYPLEEINFDTLAGTVNMSFDNIWCIAFQVWLSKQGRLWNISGERDKILNGYIYPKSDMEYSVDEIIKHAEQEEKNKKDAIRRVVIRAYYTIEKNIRAMYPGTDLHIGWCIQDNHQWYEWKHLRGNKVLDYDSWHEWIN